MIQAMLGDSGCRRMSSTSLEEAIDVWVDHWNVDPQPFVWKTAEEIITKVRRGRMALVTQPKSAMRHRI